ncbi:MAG TPA: hypothetical protein VMG08_19190 [Allosphingosinicella sp.]|nr:hypothetical protein [Allosphingosinicella sp.]
MRTGALTLVLLLMASCGRSGSETNGPAAARHDRPQPPSMTAQAAAETIVVAATGPNGCAASWNGEAVTPEQITARSVALLERAIAAAGGPRNATEQTFPVLGVEAPADLGFACADTILFALQRAGLIRVRLKPAGSGPAVLADFPLDMDVPPPPVPMVLGIGAGGRITWNDDPVDDAELAAQLRRIGGDPAEPGEMWPPPGGLELRVEREATFGQVHALLRTTSRYNLRPSLSLPSAEAGPAPSGTAPARP